MDLGLEDKRVLVTGSSSGIGVAIADMLAAEGASVIVHGRNVERTEAVARQIAQRGGKTFAVCGDLSTDDGAAAVAQAAASAFGGIDILVNNAGGAVEGKDRSWFKATLDDFRQSYDRNLLAAVRLIHAVVPAMKERGWGRIINISTAAAHTPTSAQAEYGTAKAAMLNMTLGLSKALKQSGVTCNAVSPGMVRTEGLTRFLASFAEKRGWGDDIARAEEYIVNANGQTSKRVGEVEDIAYAVAFLASPRADFMNGTNLHVDGGTSPSMH
jgi:NAD(P)-dependent dehydrogenase (short-subunit alcohol dehydrogenase family)